MNKSKLPMPAKARKKMIKEIRGAQGSRQQASSDDTTAEQLLSRYPEKTRKKEIAQLASLKKAMDAKKQKEASKTSKRTTPGKVQVETTPQSSKVEGKRWVKATAKKIQASNKVLQHNAGKKK